MKPYFERKIPDGDELERNVCRTCGFIAYENPKIVTGAVIAHGDKIVLCKRAIEPRRGFWTIPAGFLEINETVEEGAKREAREEACANIEIEQMLAVYSVPHISQIQIFYRARLLNEDINPGIESEAVDLYRWGDIPWEEMAFPTAIWALRHYRQTRDQSGFAPFTNPVD